MLGSKTPPFEDSYEENWWVSEAMMTYGGSFVRLLGEALRVADPINSARLREAFPDYWAEYSGFAKSLYEKNAKVQE